MMDIEIALTDLGELATRKLVKIHKPLGLRENIKMAKRGGKIARNTREDIERNLWESVVSNKNLLNYQYVNDKVKIK